MRRYKRRHLATLLLGLVIVFLSWWLDWPGRRERRGPKAPDAPDGASGEVVRVVDGDTFRVRLDENGQELTVRLLGVDCPESHRNSKCERDGRKGRKGCRWQVPRGKKASALARELLGGRRVLLECGGRCRRGGYGRALRYLRLADGRDYGLEMIRRGACEDFGFRYPHPRHERYARAQQRARQGGLGMWAR